MRGLKRAQYLAIALLVTIIFAVIQAPKPQTQQVQTIEEALPKTVMVHAGFTVKKLVLQFDEKTNTISVKEEDADVIVHGSGVFINKNGCILTAAHVLQVSTRPLGVYVDTFDGNSYPAEVLNISKIRDLALLKIETTKPTPYAKLADSREFRVGQEVISIGNPLGFPFTVTHGIISGLNVDVNNGYNFIQSDSFMNPGNSGGPLFDLSGRLVGINSRIVPPVNAPIFTGLGFAVSSDQIREYLVKFKDLGR